MGPDNSLEQSARFAIGGCRFESQPGLLRTKVYSPSFPPGLVNEYQLWLGRQRQVWHILLADATQGSN